MQEAAVESGYRHPSLQGITEKYASMHLYPEGPDKHEFSKKKTNSL